MYKLIFLTLKECCELNTFINIEIKYRTLNTGCILRENDFTFVKDSEGQIE